MGVTLPEADEAAPVPALLVAVTLKVYACPLVSPLTMSGLALPVTARPPGDAVAVYELMLRPPVLEGAVKETVTLRFAPATEVIAGAPGTPVGVTALEALEAAPVFPALFVAVTVKVYEVPLVRPVTAMGLAVPVPMLPPGLAVAV